MRAILTLVKRSSLIFLHIIHDVCRKHAIFHGSNVFSELDQITPLRFRWYWTVECCRKAAWPVRCSRVVNVHSVRLCVPVLATILYYVFPHDKHTVLLYFFYMKRPPIMSLETVNRLIYCRNVSLKTQAFICQPVYLICNLLSVNFTTHVWCVLLSDL